MIEFPGGYRFDREHDFIVKIERGNTPIPMQSGFSFVKPDESKKYSYVYVWSLDENEVYPQFLFVTQKMIGNDQPVPTSQATIDHARKAIYIRHDDNPHRRIVMDGKRAEAFIEAYDTWRAYSIILGGESDETITSDDADTQ